MRGFPVSELIAYCRERSMQVFDEFPGFVEQFTIDGRAPRAGESWKSLELAGTPERIAAGGRDAFYAGDIARTLPTKRATTAGS